MSNTITAYFKGRVGVAEAVYQNDYGIVMVFDSIDLPAHFDCYFSRLNQEEALPGVGADSRVAIPNSILADPGNVTVHVPLHTGENDSEVEYIVYFKVIGRARPIDDGTPTQMTAIEQALALLQNPITNIEQIVNEALAFTGETFEEMQEDLDEWKTDTEEDLETWKGGVESDFNTLQAQFDTAVGAVTTDTEVTDIRVGADGVTDATAGASVRRQFTDVKSDINVIDNNLAPIYADYYRYNTVDISEELQNGFYENGVYYANGNYRAIKHDCSVGERYKISTYLRLINHWAIVYFYNANNVLVAKYGGDADGTLTQDTYYENYEVEVPNGAIYFVVSSYVANGKPLKLAQWEEINRSANYREVSFRYLENLNIQNGVYDHGTFYPQVSYQTVKVPCVSGDVFKIDAYYNGAANQPVAQFYDSNMVLISTTTPITTTGQQNDVLVLVPDGCAYVVFVNYIIADTVNFNIRKYINGEYPLFQKNYIALGDSITAIKDGWRPWFQKVTGANEILCTAVSGATLCDYDDTVVDGNPEATAHSNTLSNQVQEILNDPPSEDINFIVISAGTNDHASASEFDGGVTQFVDHTTNTYINIDTVDRTRYDGAMRWIAEKLWSQFPNADIFWCTPIQGAEDVRQTWVQIRKCDYMKEVASHLACPVIDATRNSGIYGRYETNNANGKYLRDGLHPNMYGRKKLGLFYAGEIIDYYSYEID